MSKKDCIVGIAHYHSVDSSLYRIVDGFLWSLINQRIENGCNVFSTRITLEDCELLTEFQRQMALSYVHPRRDAMSLLYPSANPFVLSPLLETKKNLSV